MDQRFGISVWNVGKKIFKKLKGQKAEESRFCAVCDSKKFIKQMK